MIREHVKKLSINPPLLFIFLLSFSPSLCVSLQQYYGTISLQQYFFKIQSRLLKSS